jgi:hypothetical protein
MDLVQRRSGWRLALIIVTLLLAIGHICELPFEATLVAPVEAGDAHGHDDAVHGGSCEAMTTSAGVALDVPVTFTGISIADVVPATPRNGVVVSVPAATSAPPPLFLLHSALLI